MGMSTYVQGFVSKENETYKKHEKVLLACNDAGVSLPKETAEYFGTDESENYVLEEFLERTITQHEWNDGDMCNALLN